MKLTCHQYNGGFNQQNQGFNPSHQGHTGGEAAVRSYLSTKGCKCHDTAYLNVTSTDSRTKKSNKEQLGLYKMESTSSVHNGKPYWAKRQQSPKKTYYLYWEPNKNTWFISDTLGSRSGIMHMENNANGVCPSNAVTGKYWERKNSFSVMGRDKTLKTECNGPDKLGWTSLPGGGSIKPHHGPIQNPIMDGINAGRANLDKLKQAGCKCHNKDQVTFSSRDSRTKSKHAMELGTYKFEGQLHNGRPYYVMRGQPKTYYMYWNNSEKTWWIGESLTNNKALMKMQSNSSLKCPADPLGVNDRKKDWQRKNSVGWWGDDSTATVRCG